MKAHFRSLPKQQNGVALVVSLILLIVITLLGLSSIRVVLEEKWRAMPTIGAWHSGRRSGLARWRAIAEAQSKLGNPNQDSRPIRMQITLAPQTPSMRAMQVFAQHLTRIAPLVGAGQLSCHIQLGQQCSPCVGEPQCQCRSCPTLFR